MQGGQKSRTQQTGPHRAERSKSCFAIEMLLPVSLSLHLS